MLALSWTPRLESAPAKPFDGLGFVLAGGALASFEATRYAAGRKNGLRIELNGSAGSLAFAIA